MAYFNTTNLEGSDLKQECKNAKKQDDAVVAIFRHLKKSSPSVVFSLYKLSTGKEFTPITSIRRSINTLTDSGILTMTDEKIQGMYGKKEHIWELVSE